MTQNNLATIYFDRIRGELADNLEEAIRNAELALQVYTREALPTDWARAQHNLAIAYAERISGERTDNLEEAIQHAGLALQVFTAEAYPELWSATQNTLANAYSNRIRGERADNLEEAIQHFELALQVFTREAFPAEWSMMQNNLALTYAKRIRGERTDNLEEAIRHYKLALEVRTHEAFPDGTRQTGRNLGDACTAKGDWQAARSGYAIALQAAEMLFRSSVSPSNQADSARELAGLYNRDIGACLHIYPGDALVARDVLIAAEAARSRAFLKQMGLRDFTPPTDIPAHLIAREHALREDLRQIEQELSRADLRADRATERERALVARRTTLTREQEEVWDEMLATTPYVRDYVSLRRGDTPAWDDLRDLAERIGKDAALVEFHNLDDQIVAMIWRAGWDTPRLVLIPLSQETFVHRYLRPYEAEVRNYLHHISAGRAIHNDWLSLGEILLAPLEPVLGDATLVYFIPHGYLHTVPLHALTCNGEPFILKRAVAYAPSAAGLDKVLYRQPPIAGDQTPDALVMGYTPRENERETFIGEAEEIAALFGGEALVDHAATADALTQHAPHARLIHLSCHGVFNAADALGSAVLLSGGTFTARDWMRLQLHADMVTLSACQS